MRKGADGVGDGGRGIGGGQRMAQAEIYEEPSALERMTGSTSEVIGTRM